MNTIILLYNDSPHKIFSVYILFTVPIHINTLRYKNKKINIR